ncbi:hypothetical protein ACPOLB_15210 [Rubrivivax sp. RP6-9]|uniref:hypothetical protein n=1 Tax=Rubrivivax sp. RP6-9 TaxID=3415750 RepID=UPI003CC50D44
MQHHPVSLEQRRRALLRLLALGAGMGAGAGLLGGCGGGGADSPAAPTPPSPPPPTGPSGALVYRNSTAVGVYSFATRSERQFDPGSQPFPDPGVSASAAGLVSTAREGDAGSDFNLGFFRLDGTLATSFSVARDLAFQTSAVVFSADGTRIAFSVDEPASPSNSTRIARTVVATWPAGSILAEIDLHEDPVWAGNELLVRDAATLRLRRFDTNLVDQGLLGTVQVGQQYGSCTASADGRFVAWQDNASPRRIQALDRSTGGSWTAVQDDVSDTRSPVFSPDARHLALLTRGVFFDVPHVLPFATGSTVTVDSAVHELGGALTNCGGRIGWAP